MILHRPLDHIFSARSQVAVLRVLLDSAHGLTGREIARQAGMNHQACIEALTRLETLGLLRRQRGGRAHLFTINRDHELMAKGIVPLLRIEREFREQLKEMLRRKFQGVVLSGAIFGSVARREEAPGSDLDVCLVVASLHAKEKAHTLAQELAPTIWQRYGARLAPVILTRNDLRRRNARRDPLVRNLLREADSFVGGRLTEYLDDQKD
ncbi:MAG: nucleotidyltransferase domain-containing protein [Candidatus Tectomicrobia bacterium]|uniref:Nucleotidyltransferase domain-containing protein n=1 Tax=Tectimicrobiota bacterium TaxID=2528274 RepID=A0A932GRY1_UNCTE|nr:nucleotidyltransferase domain-containing protein [Candidatus Tectomicrobia bacterium]